MQELFFDEKITKSTRLVLCPNCDNESRTPIDTNEVECEECGECFLLEAEGAYPEEFVWHPSEDF